ncbi:MAG TPA: hydrogenase maturation protease [Terracidiphilus sp.]|jgi:hydrogenase maturation protease
MSLTPPRCLILACGNTLRGDDGVGLWLAEWAEQRFSGQPGVRVIADHQWSPELAEDVARAQSVLFIDCSLGSEPGSLKLTPVKPSASGPELNTHHLGAAELLALGQELYNSLPREALQLTIGAGSTELGEHFSPAVTTALPDACKMIEEVVLQWLPKSE